MKKSIKFLHQRNILPEPTEKDKERGMAFSLSCHGGATIGYIYNSAENELKVAMARCSPEENYNKRVGRDIVMGRLLSKKPNRHTVVKLDNTPLTKSELELLVWEWAEDQEEVWEAVREHNYCTVH